MSATILAPQFPKKLDILFQDARYKVLHGGRGGAKSWGVARALLLRGIQRAPMRWLCAREYQNSIAESVHQLFEDQIGQLGLRDCYEVQNRYILGRPGSPAAGTMFGFEGLHHNVVNLKSWEGADGAWVEEGQAVSKNSWNILIPTIRKDGSEIWVTYNPEFEDDDTHVRFVVKPPRNALVREINWRDNPWFPKVLEEERLDCLERDPDAYDHVWEGKCKQWLEGAIYAKELRKAYTDDRIGKVAYDPAIPVYTAWDLGHTDDTAIWWYQVVMGEIHILEGYATSGGSLSEYATQIMGMAVQIDMIAGEVVAIFGPAVKNKDLQKMADEVKHRQRYKYAKHHLPHDARAKTLAAQGKSIIQQLAVALGLENLTIVPDIGVEDGIQATRMMFGQCWFDADGCDGGLKALRRYQRELQQDERSYKKIPKHDWTSHYSDAFRMMAVATQGEVKKKKEAEKIRDGVEASEAPGAVFRLPSLDTMWGQQRKQAARY